MKRPSRAAFTLVELLVVIAIIGTLTALVLPEYGKFISRARSVTCMNNLRQIGVSVLSYVGDNDNTYPAIEPNPEDPVYTADDEEESVKAELPQGILEELGPYGLTESILKCPADIAGKNYFAQKNPPTSYQWRVTLDSENASGAKIYGGRRGYGVRIVKPSRVTICTDFEPVHFGRMNRLYADGHVVAKLIGN